VIPPEFQAVIDAGHDETRALTLALIEQLTTKLLPGSYQTILSKADAAAIVKRAGEMVDDFRRERKAAASSLVLPPGANR